MIVNVTAIVVTLHRRSSTAVRHRCAQHCDSENEHSAVAAKTSTAVVIAVLVTVLR